MLLHEGLHLLLGEGVDGLGQLHAVLAGPVLDELVGPEPLLTLLAVHQGIGEAAQMAGGHPGLGIHQDGGVQAYVVGVLLDELLPPGLFDVVFQLHTQRAVVPGVGQAAVDLAAAEDKAAAFAQGDDLLHRLVSVFHVPYSFYLAQDKKRPEPFFGSGRTKLSVVPPEFVPGWYALHSR